MAHEPTVFNDAPLRAVITEACTHSEQVKADFGNDPRWLAGLLVELTNSLSDMFAGVEIRPRSLGGAGDSRFERMEKLLDRLLIETGYLTVKTEQGRIKLRTPRSLNFQVRVALQDAIYQLEASRLPSSSDVVDVIKQLIAQMSRRGSPDEAPEVEGAATPDVTVEIVEAAGADTTMDQLARGAIPNTRPRGLENG